MRKQQKMDSGTDLFCEFCEILQRALGTAASEQTLILVTVLPGPFAFSKTISHIFWLSIFFGLTFRLGAKVSSALNP